MKQRDATPVVFFRPPSSGEAFAVSKAELRARMQTLKRMLTAEEESFVRSAIGRDLPNPVVVNGAATEWLAAFAISKRVAA